MQVLVADDDPVYRQLLSDLLGPQDYEVVCVENGTDAWDALQCDSPPKLLISDWLMPGLDGFELCSKIRRSGRLRDTYVLLLTGSRQKAEIIRVLVAGADDYLIKPFDAMELEIRIRTAQRILDLRAEVAKLRSQLNAGAGAAADRPVKVRR